MRRTIAATVLAVATATSMLCASPTTADPGTPAPASAPLPALPPTASERALAVAERVLDGAPRSGDPDATLALRDLRLALPRLAGPDQERATALLARPTDGSADRFGDGYRVKSTRRCSRDLCIHYVTSTSDKPATGWVDQTLKQMRQVWSFETDTLHYRQPLSDGGRGGDSRFDVYLKDVGARGLYGYCSTEKRRYAYTFSGYCVLDNDFAPSQFNGAPALNSLKVTAAHEFFHAVQFAYDASEDPWFMESTATWMEERFADSINDNRQYLPYGQLGQPQTPLDTWASGAFSHYGNWVWWEFLSERRNTGVVRLVWEKAATYKGAPDLYSTQATAEVLKKAGGFAGLFGAFASANTLPAATYSEGADWPSAPMSDTATLTTGTPSTGARQVVINHMAARNVRLRPGSGITGSNWTLAIEVDGPGSLASPVVKLLTLMKDGSVVRDTLRLDEAGDGTALVGFDGSTVSSVTVTLANASTRFRCWQPGSTYSCRGVPRDDSKTFTYTATAEGS